jgi:release factor glutamine methyltransferase
MGNLPPQPADVISRLRSAGCVFAEEEAALLVAAAATAGELDALVRRRVAGVPLEQVLGWAEFCGLRIALDPQVFVPRRRTEYLVRRGTNLLQARREAGAVGIPVVVDLCCGSGAVAAALAAAAGPLELHAADIDPVAAACARRNVLPLGGEVHEGDLYGALPDRLRGRVDLLAVNAPYVPSGMIGAMPPEARLHEPLASLDGGPDGLELQRRVAAAAPEWLAPGGHLLIETSRQQAPQTVQIFAGSGLSGRVFSSRKRDATVVLGAVAARAGVGPAAGTAG